MHDAEKSDSAIVAVKPPNKAGLPVAEAADEQTGGPFLEVNGTHPLEGHLKILSCSVDSAASASGDRTDRARPVSNQLPTIFSSRKTPG